MLAPATAQSILSGAENSTSSKHIVNWTIGNTISESVSNDKYNIIQGAIFNTYRMHYEETEKLKITCFPNPSKDHFFLEIKSNTPEKYKWSITSETGQILKSEQANKSLIRIDISQLNAHRYYIYIQNKNGKNVASVKLIKN